MTEAGKPRNSAAVFIERHADRILDLTSFGASGGAIGAVAGVFVPVSVLVGAPVLFAAGGIAAGVVAAAASWRKPTQTK